MTQAPSLDGTASLRLTGTYRGISALELLVAAAIVVAHNVFHALPNEVPILFVLGVASIRLREGSWSAIGLGRPKSWWRTIAVAFLAAIIVIVVGQLATEPLAHFMKLSAGKTASNSLGMKQTDVWTLIKALAITWTFAAFGEEIAYRRYLLGRAADVGGRNARAYWLALVIASALFGVGHYYQGPAGMFTTACDGFLIGAAYLLSGRNLWVAVFTHGFVDTIAFGAVFFGLAD